MMKRVNGRKKIYFSKKKLIQLVFKQNVQEQFRKAGWFEGRDVKSIFESKIKFFNSLPSHVKDFLISYGNLLIEDSKPYESEVINALNTDIRYIESTIEKDLPFSEELFRIGYFYPDHYMVYTDKDRKIYLVGDFYYKINDDFEKGIESLIEDDWRQIKGMES